MSASNGNGAPAPPQLHADLYALVVYLHASCNGDLLDAIALEQLSFNQLQLLDRLRTGMRPTITQAAKIMHTSPGGASRMVANLARRGLVLREEDERDYRAVRVVITPRGDETIARLHACRLEQIMTFTDELGVEEREQLQAALAHLLERDQVRAFRPLPAAA